MMGLFWRVNQGVNCIIQVFWRKITKIWFRLSDKIEITGPSHTKTVGNEGVDPFYAD